MNEHQQLAIQALMNMRGDNLERAEQAFRNCTQAQMNEKYGDKTRAEILADYKEHAAKVAAAIEWVKAQQPTDQ